MPTATLEGSAVTALRLTLPRVGAWTALAELDADEAPSGSVELQVAGVSFRGFVVSGGTTPSSTRVRLVGGAGGLGGLVGARSYRNVPAELVLSDLLAETGELLAPTSDSDALQALLPHWAQRAGRAAEALGLLVDAVERTWRVLPSGFLWIGSEPWPEAELADGDVLEDDLARARRTLALGAPGLLPGQILEGKRVSAVVYTLEPGRMRAEVWFE